jgi:phage FluMu protein Com
MAKPVITCPHCGKLLSSEEKVAYHLIKECTKITSATFVVSSGTPPGASESAPRGK